MTENILSRKMRDLRMAHPIGVEPMTFGLQLNRGLRKTRITHLIQSKL